MIWLFKMRIASARSQKILVDFIYVASWIFSSKVSIRNAVKLCFLHFDVFRLFRRGFFEGVFP